MQDAPYKPPFSLNKSFVSPFGPGQPKWSMSVQSEVAAA